MPTQKRVTIVGQAPGPKENRTPFDGDSGHRLAKAAGLTLEELRECAVLRNVLERYPGPDARKGDRFPVREARESAARMRFQTELVVFAGVETAGAFGIREEFFRPVTFRRTRTGLIIPHPSGISHWWNCPKKKHVAERFLRELFAET